MKFNIIGFDFQNYSVWKPTKHCAIDQGTILIPKRNEKGEYEPHVLQCPRCGTTYLENEAATTEKIEIKHQKQKTAIISGNKTKKKYYDKQGNEINDDTLLDDIARGATVISYREEKSGEISSAS